MKKNGWIILLVFSLAWMQSCKKTELSIEKMEVTTDDAEFIIETEKITDDFYEFIDVNAFEEKTIFSRKNFVELPSCAEKSIVIHSPTHYTITLKFENTGCELPNGDTYLGTLIIERNFNGNDKTYSGEIIFDNFSINGIKIEGKVSFIHLLVNQSGVPESDYEYELTFHFANGDIAKQTGNKIRIWIEGFSTVSLTDNIFLITGKAYILKRNGVEIHTNITLPLKKIATCPFYVSGRMAIEKENQQAVLDFGDGSCNNTATLIFPDGHTVSLRLIH